jgi:signal transduction histidine kinase
MAFVVHDLKNPVAAMDLHAQLLLRDKKLDDSARSSASHIRAEARQLTRMILNILDLSKADEGRLEPHKTDLDLRPLVAEVMGELAVAAASRELELETGALAAKIHADEDLLRRTLVNLVDNAMRHTPRGTKIKVSAVEERDAVVLRVEDRGPGIPPESRDKVFDAFVQLDPSGTARAQFGRGLGLSFCKLVAESHGGRIWIEDASPGAIFCVSFRNGG